MAVANKLRYVLIVTILGVIACGASIDLGTSTETQGVQKPFEISPTFTILATREDPTPRPTRTPFPTPNPYFRDDFDNTSSLDDIYLTWFGDENYFDYYIQDGELILNINTIDTYVYFVYEDFHYDDVRIDVEVRNDGDYVNWITLVCRWSDLGWYEFNVGSDGFYEIYRYDDPTNNFVSLYDGGSTYINTGLDTNIFTAICQGDTLSLLINGHEARTITDNRLSSGSAGFSGSSLATSNVDVGFGWVEFSRP